MRSSVQAIFVVLLSAFLSLSGSASLVAQSVAERPPNIVLLMADDLGWGDVGFNGGTIIETPSLDAMASNGMKFTRFYAAAPVCSPTRGSCLTGRHPYRYGVRFANVGHLRASEATLPELLNERGYATGHFGKWHLGTLSPDYSGKGERRKPRKNYATPAMNGFEEWFSTEYAVATWDPYDPENRHGSRFDLRNLYWHNGENVTEPLTGDDSRIIMDRAIPFIRGAVEQERPFFTVIWFHTPHSPVVGGPEYRRRYAQYDEEAQHYYACVTAMDEQIGRLRGTLRELEVADNTMLWFCSDNGPARQGSKRHVGSPGPFRGFKVSLFEGGVRVPAVWEWPGKVPACATTDFPTVTSDYLPTIIDILGVPFPDNRPLDGISLKGLLSGSLQHRPEPIGFQSGRQRAMTDNRFKLLTRDAGKTWKLFDLIDDPAETNNLAAERPREVARLKAALRRWQASCRNSAN